MATSESSFEQLLSKAPAVSSSDTITVVGALARSPEKGKFVLATADGQTFTLDSGAVTDHRVLAESVGQLLVELKVDTTRIPKELRAAVADRTIKLPLEVQTYMADPLTASETTAEVLLHPYTVPVWVDHGLWFGNPGPGAVSPYVMAAAHQAPYETLLALQGPWTRNHSDILKVQKDPGQDPRY